MLFKQHNWVGIFYRLMNGWRTKMTDQQLKDMISVIAQAEREAGTAIDYDPGLPYVAIIRDGVTAYSFQEWQAQELLDIVPEDVSVEDYLLFYQSSW